MIPSDIQFTGTHQAQLDSTLRLHIPADWQHSRAGLLYLLCSCKSKHAYIKAINEAAYDERFRMVMDSQITMTEKERLVGRLANSCRAAKPDRRNRIALPKDLAGQAGLENSRAITLVGGGNYFEIWETGIYDASMQQGQDP